MYSTHSHAAEDDELIHKFLAEHKHNANVLSNVNYNNRKGVESVKKPARMTTAKAIQSGRRVLNGQATEETEPFKGVSVFTKR